MEKERLNAKGGTSEKLKFGELKPARGKQRQRLKLGKLKVKMAQPMRPWQCRLSRTASAGAGDWPMRMPKQLRAFWLVERKGVHAPIG
jgi:hypothetical protein